MKVIPETRRAHYIRYLRFYYYHWVDSSCGLLVPECIIRPVVRTLELPWFIRYIYNWNLQFLNNVIINKLRFSSPPGIGDHSRFYFFAKH